MLAVRCCWGRTGYKKGARGWYDSCTVKAEDDLLSKCSRGDMMVVTLLNNSSFISSIERQRRMKYAGTADVR